jgi:CDP-glycerol glycerophosphotransferase
MSYQSPLFSIIVPTYNRETLLSKALHSVFSQIRQDVFRFEILVVDDGSTDGTFDVVDKFQKEYQVPIRYFFQENSGVGKARNTGLQHISNESDYVIFLDSDDEFKEDLLFSIVSKYNELKNRDIYEKTIGLYFLCQTET